jgi:Xaa-Pro dipeptidase
VLEHDAMGITEASVTFDERSLEVIQGQLRTLGIGGWLLYDFRGANPIATGVLGLPALTRRFFVLIPAEGRPMAITHQIEQQPWRGWIGEKRTYLSWQSLESEIGLLVTGLDSVAVETSSGDAVPYVDRVPAGVLELIQRTGVRTVSSGDLVSAVYAQWGSEGEASHHRAAHILRQTVHAAFDSIGERLRSGDSPNEWEVRQWVVGELANKGLGCGADAIVAVNANAANPHYAPSAHDHATIEAGQVVLIDLWGKESETFVFADQTWMAFVGGPVPDRVENLWRAVRDARDAAVELIRSRSASGQPVAGYEVDNACRAVLVARGLGDAFIHRTGHSIDRELHGSGPNIDNLETRDTRRLIPGIGFSIEPGVYLPGDIGFRSEINVFMGADGPIVTTPDPQTELYPIRVS